MKTSFVLALAVSLAGCGDDDPAGGRSGRDSQKALEVREISLPHEPVSGQPERLFGHQPPALFDVLAALKDAAETPEVKGIFLRLGSFPGGWGTAADLHRGLASVRRSGKVVHCHFDATDNAGYYILAKSCDRISMTPAGDLDLVGAAAHLVTAKRALDQLGIAADLEQRGRFKGAADPFTNEVISDDLRASMTTLVDDLYLELVRSIASGRNVPEATVRTWIDQGPYDSDTAKRNGLIDDIAFDDEAREEARKAAHAARVSKVDLSGSPVKLDLDSIVRALGGDVPGASLDGPRMALVYLDGTIEDSEEEDANGSQSGPFVQALRDMARDDGIKAIVLRIDSPGGSALASDRMWHAVHRAAQKKPVIVSIGNMAASGGYYVASAATEIIANESSLVGSIGVVGGKVQAGELLGRLGVNVEVLSRGAHAGWTSPTRPFTDSERGHLRQMLDRTYDRFLDRITTGRGVTRESLEPAAEGRLMTGTRAKELGLINNLGGLDDAIEWARGRGSLPRNAPIERWPRQRTFLDAIADLTGANHSSADARLVAEVLLGRWIKGRHTREVIRTAAFSWLNQENASFVLPFGFYVQ